MVFPKPSEAELFKFIDAFSGLLSIENCKKVCYSLLTELADKDFNLDQLDGSLLPKIFSALTVLCEGENCNANNPFQQGSQRVICALANYLSFSHGWSENYPLRGLSISALCRIFDAVSKCPQEKGCQGVASILVSILARDFNRAIDSNSSKFNLDDLSSSEFIRLLEATNKF